MTGTRFVRAQRFRRAVRRVVSLRFTQKRLAKVENVRNTDRAQNLVQGAVFAEYAFLVRDGEIGEGGEHDERGAQRHRANRDECVHL